MPEKRKLFSKKVFKNSTKRLKACLNEKCILRLVKAIYGSKTNFKDRKNILRFVNAFRRLANASKISFKKTFGLNFKGLNPILSVLSRFKMIRNDFEAF